MLALKHFRDRAKGLPDLLGYAAVIDDGVVLGKDGSLLAGWHYRGQDLGSATPEERAATSARVNAALARLGSGWMLHVDAMRQPAQQYPPVGASHFPDPITRLIDAERRAQFEAEGVHFETLYGLTVTYLPPRLRQSQVAQAMYDDDASGPTPKRLASKLLAQFQTALCELEDTLGPTLHLERLRGVPIEDVHGGFHVQDRLLQSLHDALTGLNSPIYLPPCPMYLDSVIGGHELWTGLTPKLDDDFLAVVAIDGFPQESTPGLLAALDQLPLAYRWNTRFLCLDTVEALDHLKAYRRKWQQKVRGFVDQVLRTQSGVVDQDALAMVADTEGAMAEASSQMVAYGYYTSVVVLRHPEREALEEQARWLRRTIQNLGFSCRIETVNCVDAWLGSLPGHGGPNVRRPLLHTLNLADLLPLSAVWPGRATCPCPFYPPESPPLVHAATDGSTPFRLNLHVGDVGHTLIFGPTGAGKSTLLALLAAQFRRYREATIFAFDKGHSLLPLTLAAGGSHYAIGSEPGSLSFCPLAGIDSDAEQAWAQDWVQTLLTLQGLSVQTAHRHELHRALGLLRTAPPEARTLTDLITTLQDTELRQALEPYSVSGAGGHLLDAPSDTLDAASFMTFEIEDLMHLGDAFAIPVLLYLFHALERRLQGQPTLLLLDEAWLMLGHPVFRAKIREWLKVLRKANCAVVLATQSLSDASGSGILDVLVESCPTKILLPNVTAQDESSRPLYTQIGLNAPQIARVAGALPKRQVYVISPEGKRLVDLHLGPVALAFIGASGKEDLAAIRALEAAHGPQWPWHWLDQRGVAYALDP